MITSELRHSVLIPDTADLRDAMDSLRQSGRQLAVVEDATGKVVGVLTDGDIRKALLKNSDLHQPAVGAMTGDFVWVPEGTPKERILKLLDSRVRVIPVLNENGGLVDLVGAGYREPQREGFVRARAPVRLSLAGGGTDFTSYFRRHGGVSLCATIARYAHAMLRRRDDRRIRIYSHDQKITLEYASIDEMTYDGRLDLLKAGVKVMRPDFGFDLDVGCDYLPGSGLGGSAALLVAIIGCFNELREDKLDAYAVAEHAFEAERVELSISGGWQDQYSTVFGGFNFIEFDDAHNTVVPLRLQPNTLNELEERFIICFSGRTHNGEQVQAANASRDPDDPEVLSFANQVKDIAYSMRSKLLRGDLSGFGRMMDDTWRLKKAYNQGVTTPHLDEIYDAAMASGAEGGRLLGTGGGGYFLFFVKPFERFSLMEKLESMGLNCESVTFDRKGMTSWLARV